MRYKTDNPLLIEWQKRLGLLDWAVKIVDNLCPDDMDVNNVDGCVIWEESIKTAKIEILDPKYYGDRMLPFDYEKILVHELLHLKLVLISDEVESLQARYMHQIIDDLARAFVDAKRCGAKMDLTE